MVCSVLVKALAKVNGTLGNFKVVIAIVDQKIFDVMLQTKSFISIILCFTNPININITN